MLLDGDDWWEPNRLEFLARLRRQRPDAAILTTDAWVYDPTNARVWRWSDRFPFFEGEDRIEEIAKRNYIFGSAAVLREALDEAGGFRRDIPYSIDYDCWIRIIFRGGKAASVPLPLAWYRRHEAAMSRRTVPMLKTRLLILGDSLSLTGDPRILDVLDARMARTKLQLEVLETKEALLKGEPGARRRALELARNPRVKLETRLASGAATLVPAALRRLAARSRRDES